MPLVSIIIPCYNYSNYLVFTLESLQEQVFKETVKGIVDSALGRQLHSPLQNIANNMQKITEKKGEKDKILLGFTLVAVVIIILGFFMFKPSITGFAVITKETTYSDNLNLAVNESKTVSWNLRNPGDLKLEGTKFLLLVRQQGNCQ